MRLVFVGVALVALLVVAVTATRWLDDDGGSTDVAGLRLTGDAADVRGVGHFEQDGERLTGFVVLWGLEPRSTHAVHFHGPNSRCGSGADPVAVHPDLKADDDGVAYANVDIRAESRLLDSGYYYNVHAGPSRVAENPEIACGDLGPS